MAYTQADVDEVTRETSAEIVQIVSPEESDMFEEIFASVRSSDAGKENPDSMLGFGVDALQFLQTPAVIGMVSTVAGFLFSELVKSLKDESSVIIKAKIKKLFKKSKDDPKELLPAFTKEQYANLKKLAFDSAKKFGATDDAAEKMSLALLGSMNLPQE